MLTPALLGSIAASVAQDSAPAARWWDTAPEAASFSTQSGYSDKTVRVVLYAGLLAGSKLRFRFQAQASGSMSASAAYVQLGGAGDSYDYSGDPVEIKFGGASGFSLGTDEYIDSDEVVLPVTLADRIVVAFHSNTSVLRRSSNYVPGQRAFYKSGNDLATVDASGYTEVANPLGLVRVQAYDLEPERTTVYEWATSSRNDTWSNYNARLILPAGFFGTATKLRFRLLARTAGYTVDSMYIGHKAGAGDVYDFAAAPTQVLFGGSGSKVIGVHEVAVSDDVSFSVNSSTEMIIAMHIATGGTSVPNNSLPAGAAMRYKSGADESSTVDVSGYSSTSSSGLPIFRIEAW